MNLILQMLQINPEERMNLEEITPNYLQTDINSQLIQSTILN